MKRKGEKVGIDKRDEQERKERHELIEEMKSRGGKERRQE